MYSLYLWFYLLIIIKKPRVIVEFSWESKVVQVNGGFGKDRSDWVCPSSEKGPGRFQCEQTNSQVWMYWRDTKSESIVLKNRDFHKTVPEFQSHVRIHDTEKQCFTCEECLKENTTVSEL